MNIDARNIDEDFEKSINDIMQVTSQKTAIKAVRIACTRYIYNENKITKLEQDLRNQRRELIEALEKIEKIKQSIKFLKKL